MTAEHRRAALEAELLALFAQGLGEEARKNIQFNDLALRIFRHQYEGSPILRSFWSHRGVTPQRVRHWSEITGVPTAAFKEAPLCAFPPGEAAAIFETSGTTAGGRSGR